MIILLLPSVHQADIVMARDTHHCLRFQEYRIPGACEGGVPPSPAAGLPSCRASKVAFRGKSLNRTLKASDMRSSDEQYRCIKWISLTLVFPMLAETDTHCK
ncbi:hypothetical protein A0H81_05132 [Grifola frondosa]|uniref:Uncharacterized protein n=1 Tax=Grifola frondosa TaxID=5627 RepID=A0A1C7MD11_GRIFR|nr:hypothetical protein A0H81_05132 [Grifola frondosa]